jgi:cholesterol transport system auxiliary component
MQGALMKIPSICCLLLLPILTACIGGVRQPSPLVSYDLPGQPPELAVPLRSLDVVPSSWLAGNTMYYRLAYIDGSRREYFAESRWTGQPSELLGLRLQRSLMGADSLKGDNLCRLRIELDDLVQVFDAPGSSRMVLEGRAALYGPQQRVLARRGISLSQAAGADARSGVAASATLADALARELQGWVREECRKPG